MVQKRFKFPAESVELYAEKVNNRGLCAVAQAESLRYKLLGGLAVRRWAPAPVGAAGRSCCLLIGSTGGRRISPCCCCYIRQYSQCWLGGWLQVWRHPASSLSLLAIVISQGHEYAAAR